MRTPTFSQRVRGNAYPGRGIVVGESADGSSALAAYLIMGRSENSRNRILAERGGQIFTEPFDPALVKDPSLILYRAMTWQDRRLIVTNGDQTDTIAEALGRGGTFFSALETRTFEPDAPNFTPRISAMLTFSGGGFSYDMSILKAVDDKGTACARFFFSYPAVAGMGHFLHTYASDGDPLPPFSGEPEPIFVPNGAEEFAEEIWNALDEGNRIGLCVMQTDLETGRVTTVLKNRHPAKEARP